MATYDNPYTAEIYSSAAYPGGSLYDYTSAGAPYPNLSGVATSRPKSADNSMRALYSPLNDLTARAFGEQPKAVQAVIDPLGSLIGGLFGGKDKPKAPYWQRLANKEWAQGNAALSAYAQLYEPTLNLARRQAADYGDLYRRAANDQLAFELRSATTKHTGDLADFEALGGDYVRQLRETNPLLAQYYDAAQSNLALGSSLSPQQQAEMESYVRKGQAGRGMGLGPTDVYSEALAKTSFGENLRQQRMTEARNALPLYGDIFQATTGRPTMSPSPVGANIQAPNASIGLQDYLSLGVNYQQQDANAAAAKKAQQMQLIGAGIGAIGNLGGMAAGLCWVAREVYGEASPKWRQFRRWLTTKAPVKLIVGYAKHGEKFAKFLMEHPEHKPDVRAWMDEQLAA